MSAFGGKADMAFCGCPLSRSLLGADIDPPDHQCPKGNNQDNLEQQILLPARHRLKVGPAFQVAVPRLDSGKAVASPRRRITAALCLDGPPRLRLLQGRHTGPLAVLLERQWWADAPVNDGLFVRRALTTKL